MSVSSDTSECAICLEEKTGFIAKLSCGHTYHYSCVQSWIEKKNNFRKGCCICENDTEIIQLIGEEPLPKKKIRNKEIKYKYFSCCSIL